MQPSYSPTGAPVPGDPRFGHTHYTVKRKLMQLLGATFYVYDPAGQTVLWASQKAFKLKEDFRLFADESKSQEILRIAARSIIDFGATYDVFDSRTNQKIGTLRRQGLQSTFVRDSWVILDSLEREVGTVQEDSVALALLRRFVGFVTLILPQKFHVRIGEREVAVYSQTKNPLSSKMEIDFSADQQGTFDRRMGLAMALLLSAIEGKQR